MTMEPVRAPVHPAAPLPPAHPPHQLHHVPVASSSAAKPRKTNFTAREVEVLLGSVRRHRDTVLFGVAGGRGWAKAWHEVAATVTAVEGIVRTEGDVRKKWTYLKWEAKNTSKPGRDPTSRAVLDILTSGVVGGGGSGAANAAAAGSPGDHHHHHHPTHHHPHPHHLQQHHHHHQQQHHLPAREAPAPGGGGAGAGGPRNLLEELLVPQAPPATQKQSAPPQPPPPSQKMVPPQVSAPKQIAPKPTSTPVSPLQPLPPPPEVCLRWNSYHSNMQATFPSLLNNEQFVDVTLACEGRSIKCHKMMLSACSAYFEELLSQNPCQHPIVLMKDLKYWEVQALVDFMYRGEVNVAQDKLPSLLAAAEALQIKGLAGPAFSSHDDDNTQGSAPPSSAEDYLDESTPSPSGSRRARKRRVMSSTQSPRTQAVQSPQVPATPTRSATGKRTVKPSLSMPSTSNYQLESANLPSEPPSRRARKSESGELEIKIEPIDIEISNDSMDQMDDSFMEKAYDDTEAGDGGESSGQGDDPGGTNESKPSISSDTRMNVHGHDTEQMDFGNSSTSRNDQNFRFEDSGSQDVPDLPGTSYQESLSQPSSSGINSSDNLLGRM